MLMQSFRLLRNPRRSRPRPTIVAGANGCWSRARKKTRLNEDGVGIDVSEYTYRQVDTGELLVCKAGEMQHEWEYLFVYLRDGHLFKVAQGEEFQIIPATRFPTVCFPPGAARGS